MNRDQQIEHIARELCPFSQEYESCSKCNTELDIDGELCIYMIMAKHLTDKGYRKSSDVVREMFAEIEDIAILNGYISVSDFYTDHPLIAELKKKYESEGKE